MSRLTTLFHQAVSRVQDARIIPGSLGKPVTGSGYTFAVPGRPGYVYVLPDGEATYTEALNGGVPLIGGLRIRMERRGGLLVILGANDEQALQFLGTNANAISPFVAHHNHAIGSGLDDPVEGRRVMPGLVRVHSGMKVWIEAFHYIYNNTRARWPGGELDLTSHVPAAGKHRWVIVGVDPSDNTAAAAAGTAQDVIVVLTEDDLDDITFASKIPLAGVKLVAGMTAISQEISFVDARPWVTGLGSSFTGASGTGDEVMEWLGV